MNFRALLVPFLQHLWYDVVLDWGLNPGPPTLKANALPLGYRGGGIDLCDHEQCDIPSQCTTSQSFTYIGGESKIVEC